MHFRMQHVDRIAVLLCCCLLAACGGDKSDTQGEALEDGLPKPAAAGGSVTGMPNPGVVEARPAPRDEPQLDVVELPEPVNPDGIVIPDPATLPQPDLEPPVMLPPPPMSEDPSAPLPPPPAQSENRVPEATRR